jgi:hypothetical protein
MEVDEGLRISNKYNIQIIALGKQTRGMKAIEEHYYHVLTTFINKTLSTAKIERTPQTN